MTANTNQMPSLDDVLAEIAALSTPPDARQLRNWVNRYPEFKVEIVDFATDWIEMAAAKNAFEVTQENVDLVVDRTMSHIQQFLDEAERPPSVDDLPAEIQAAGYDLESFQCVVGIDRSMLTCLAERMIRPATIPEKLVRAIAETLNRNIESVRDFFRLPPKPAAAHKARKQPETKQVDFAFVVEYADLPENEKVRWLAEAPDPLLRK